MLSVFLAFVFRRRNANWKKDKMLSIFPFRVFGPCVGRGLQVAPEEAARNGTATSIPKALFSTPAMVAQEPSGVERLKVQTGDCQPYTASSLWLQCLVPRPKKRCAAVAVRYRSWRQGTHTLGSGKQFQ